MPAFAPLTDAFPCSYGVIDGKGWMSVNKYREEVSRSGMDYGDLFSELGKAVGAVGLVLSREGEPIANAFLLDHRFVLVSAHSTSATTCQFEFLQDDNNATTKVHTEGTLLINGANEFLLDFKLYVLNLSIDVQLPMLSLDQGSGHALQIFCHSVVGHVVQCFMTEWCMHMSRSHKGGSTFTGCSGAARFCLTHKAVQSLLQGEGEGLAIGDIVRALTLLPNTNPHYETVQTLLSKIFDRFVDPIMLFNGNPVALSVGAVEEEAKGIGKSVLKALTRAVNRVEVRYFSDNFVDKHTAPEKSVAINNQKKYRGTVTVIKITETTLPGIKSAIEQKKQEITASTIWHVQSNGTCSNSEKKLKIKYDGNTACHVDF